MAQTALVYLAVIYTFFSKGLGKLGIEPKCSNFDFEEKLLEKMVRMEHSVELMDDKIDILNKEVLVDGMFPSVFR